MIRDRWPEIQRISRLMIGGLLMISGIVLAQKAASPTASSPSALKTYTSPDRTFQFTYPAFLIRCELKQQNNGEEYSWVQPDCISYHPVCGDFPTPNEPMVCIAYPRYRYADRADFEAAVFSASETNENETDCLSQEVLKGKTVEIRGVKFYFVEEADGGMNQARHSKGYVTFHNGKCYYMSTTVGTSSAADPPAKLMTKQDWAEIHRQLNQARDSFHFLK